MTLLVKTTPRKTIPAVRSVEIEYDELIEIVREYLRGKGLQIHNSEEITFGGLDRHQVRNGGAWWLDVYIEECNETNEPYSRGWPFNKEVDDNVRPFMK